MPTRHLDWLRQAKRDLEHAQRSLAAGDYEWACFAAHQAAEKAVKGLFQKLGGEAWGHSITMLLSHLPSGVAADSSLVDRAKELDKHYIAPRYPNFHPTGAPLDFYTQGEAERAIDHARNIVAFCEDKIL
ncbi:MAG: HEPN domain-containing protein [Chloroflexi bacterium]|nr:HEPN domain-containing protein [Chloroflexota bacterium]